MDEILENLKVCFSILENEYRIEDSRRESITSRSGTFLQFSGVLAGISIVQIISELSNKPCCGWLVFLYNLSLLAALSSVIFLTIAMKVRDYSRFPNKSISIDDIKVMSQMDYYIHLIDVISGIVSDNQEQNTKRINKYSIGMWTCAVAAIILFAALIGKTVLGVKA